jgi:hypothetical protein
MGVSVDTRLFVTLLCGVCGSLRGVLWGGPILGHFVPILATRSQRLDSSG